jgi:[acyl-carrier-protein] S-malonyltransferase
MLQRAVGLGLPSTVRGQVSDILEPAFCRRLFEDTAFVPECNRDVQLGVFLANHMHWLALQRLGCTSHWSLGLSLGEYNHLVDIGALTFGEALRLVDRRGQLYDEGPEGVMVAVNGVVEGTIDEVLQAARGKVQISNYNGVSQHVLAGARNDVEAVVRVLEDKYFAVTTEIESCIPMHSALFEPVARRFEAYLRAADWRRPVKPYFPNVEGVPVADPGPEDFTRLLTEHVYRPVQWARSLGWVTSSIECPALIEVGPASVLSDLARRSWPQIPRYRTDGEPLGSHVELTAAKVSDAA